MFAHVSRAIGQVNSLVQRVVDWFQDFRIARALGRYGTARGGLLAGGIAYSAIFSIAAAATIAWTVFMAILGSHKELKNQMIDAVNQALPGFFVDPTGSTPGGLIDPDSLVLSNALTPASVVAALVLVWSAISMINALGTSIRAMFGMSARKDNPLVVYIRAFEGYAVLALGIVASAVCTLIATTISENMGMDSGQIKLIVQIGTFVGSIVIDGLVVAFLIRFVAIVRVPRRDFLIGCVLTALATTAIRLVGTTAVSSVGHNKLLASFAALATLLLWLNISARILLVASAFMANPPRQGKIESSDQLHAGETPNFVTLSCPHTLEWAHDPVTGNLMPEENTLQAGQETEGMLSASETSPNMSEQSSPETQPSSTGLETQLASAGRSHPEAQPASIGLSHSETQPASVRGTERN